MKRIFIMILLALATISLASCAKARNKPPVIEGAVDLEIEQGDPFDPMEGITANDPEDGDITENITYTGWDLEEDSTENAGNYYITYRVVDSKGLAAADVTIKLTINPSDSQAKPPKLLGVVRHQDYYIGQGGDEWNPLRGIEAEDDDGTDLTDSIEVLSSSFYDLNTPGSYTIRIRVRNEAGLVANDTILLTVHPSPIPTNIPKTEISVVMWHAMGQDKEDILKVYAQEFHDYYARPENGGYNFKVVIDEGRAPYDKLYQDMEFAITAGKIPNIVQGYPDHITGYIQANSVLSLTPYIYNSEWGLVGEDALDDIIEAYREENSSYDGTGTYYSLPFNKSTEVLVYNKTVLEELNLSVPETWQDIIEMAPQLNTWAQGQGIQSFVPAALDSTGNSFITFARQFGGKYTGIDYETGRGLYYWNTDPNTFAAMQFLNTNKNIITIPKYWDQNYASTPFMEQKTIFTIGSTAGVWRNKPKDNLFELGVAPIPYNRDMPENRQVIQQGTNVSLLKSGTNEQRFVSWLFLKWLTNTENTLDWALKSGGYLPVRTSAYESARYQQFLNNPDPKITNEVENSLAANAGYAQTDFFFYDPAFIGSAKARQQVGLALERIVYGDGKIQDALDDAYNKTPKR